METEGARKPMETTEKDNATSDDVPADQAGEFSSKSSSVLEATTRGQQNKMEQDQDREEDQEA